jgi:class 3 adenylate cyclase
VLILDGLEDLPDAKATEAAALQRIGAPPGVRLACQIRPSHSLKVRPLIPLRDAEPSLGRDAYRWGVERRICVMFSDLRGFTALAERLDAREVVQRLNAFYGHVVPVLQRHGGQANKFVGDGLLGVFGAPQRLSDHADRAVLAALDIVRTVRDVYGERLRISVGVNSGRVIAGTIGGGSHVEFTVIGDAVNTAARVEEVTRTTGDDVLVTEATRKLLTLPFCGFVERPTVALKGKTEQVRLYAPLEAAAETPADTPARPQTA